MHACIVSVYLEAIYIYRYASVVLILDVSICEYTSPASLKRPWPAPVLTPTWVVRRNTSEK